MLKKSVLPEVEIHTPNGKLTLVTANVVSIARYIPPFKLTRPPGEPAHETLTTSELEIFSFVFQSIKVENIAGTTSTNDDITSNNH
jgi:hypothetical protein